jgi:hypothetical protein
MKDKVRASSNIDDKDKDHSNKSQLITFTKSIRSGSLNLQLKTVTI